MSDYFSSWRDRGFTCGRCAWTGTAEEPSHEVFAELFEVNCPQCDARLNLVLYPTDGSIRRAAKQGHPEAQQMLSSRLTDLRGNRWLRRVVTAGERRQQTGAGSPR